MEKEGLDYVCTHYRDSLYVVHMFTMYMPIRDHVDVMCAHCCLGDVICSQ